MKKNPKHYKTMEIIRRIEARLSPEEMGEAQQRAWENAENATPDAFARAYLRALQRYKIENPARLRGGTPKKRNPIHYAPGSVRVSRGGLQFKVVSQRPDNFAVTYDVYDPHLGKAHGRFESSIGAFRYAIRAQAEDPMHSGSTRRVNPKKSKKRNPPKSTYEVIYSDYKGRERAIDTHETFWTAAAAKAWIRKNLGKDTIGKDEKVFVRPRAARGWERIKKVTEASPARYTGRFTIWSKFPYNDAQVEGRFSTKGRANVVLQALEKAHPGGTFWVEAKGGIEERLRKLYEHYEEGG